ncbi:MAG: hypothetical protein ACT4OX_10365 [Actinomycetota bacterium]
MRRSALGALAFVAMLATANPARAATTYTDLALTPSPDSALDAKTGAVRVAVQPGGGVWQSAVLTNRSRVRLSVRLAGGGNGGTDTWIQPAIDTVLLEPGKSQTVDFTIAPPADATGDAMAALVATVVDAPSIALRLDVLVELIGVPVAQAAAPAGAPPATISSPTQSDAARAQGSDAADRMLLVGIVATLVVLVLAIVVPALVETRRRVRRRRDRRGHSVVDIAAERFAEREHLRSVLGTATVRTERRARSKALDVAALNQQLARRA